VQRVVKRTSICKRENWLFVGKFCARRLAKGFPGLGVLCAPRSVQGFLEQFAAMQAHKQASLFVSKIAVFSDFVFGL
jgi:hypothetical protein